MIRDEAVQVITEILAQEGMGHFAAVILAGRIVNALEG